MPPKTAPVTTGSEAVRAALFLAVVIAQLIFTPWTTAPVVDAKLVMLLAAALTMSIGRGPIDRTLMYAAGAWVGALVLASVLGRDAWWSILGHENQSMGVLALAACSFLLVAATGAADDDLKRVPLWLYRVGVTVSVAAVVARFAGTNNGLAELTAGLMGHRVFAAGVIGAALVAAVMLEHRPITYLAMVVLGSGLAVTAARSAWLGTAAGLAIVALRDPGRWKPVARVTVVVLLTLGAWTLAERPLPESDLPYSAAPRFTELQEGSAQERVRAWQTNVRAWRADPILGSGPATGWYGFLREASARDIREAGRNFGDAHNIFLETATTSGVVGLLGLVALLGFAAWRIVHAPRSRGWAAGVVAVVGTIHLFQPLNIRLTPLLFLFAGIAAGPPAEKRRVAAPRVITWIAIPCLLLSLLRFGSSWLEHYGASYDSVAALRASLILEPRRRSATIELAEVLSFYRESDADLREARAFADRAVSEHPWNPAVRLQAAEVLGAMGDNERALEIVESHLDLFPNDALAWAGAASLALRLGDHAEAERLAKRALAIDPDTRTASSVLGEATAETTPARR